MASILTKTRAALNVAGMNNKTISYTCKYNAFWDTETGNIPKGWTAWQSDGEALGLD